MKSITAYLTLLWALLLPWQARLILREGSIAGEPWQYGTISVSAAEVILGILFFILLWNSRTSLRRFIPFAFLVTVLFWGVARADDSLLAFSRAMLLLTLIFVASATRSFANISSRELVVAYLCGMLPHALFGIGQFLVQEVPASTILGTAAHHASVLGDSVVETSAGRYLRAYGSFPHPNVFGGFLAVGIVVSAWLWAHATRFGERLFASVSCLVNLAALFFTFSRGAWIAAVLGLALLLTSIGWKRAAPAVASALALASLLGFVAFPLLQTRIAAQGRLEAKSITERVEGFGVAWRVFREKPVLGVGMGNATLALAHAFPGLPSWQYQPPHSAFLAAVLEVGFLGVLALFWALVPLLQGVRKNPIGLSVLAILVTASLFDHYLWTLPPGLGLLGFGTLFASLGTPLLTPTPVGHHKL